MSHEDVKDERLFDVRTIERSIRRGLVTRKEYEKFVKGLPDVTEKAITAEVEPAERPAEAPAPAPEETPVA